MKRVSTIIFLPIILGMALPVLVASVIYLVGNATSQESNFYYLPLIKNDHPIFISDLVRYDAGYEQDFQIGEVVNLSANKSYSITLEAVVSPQSNITGTYTIHTALTATLPGFANPFSILVLLGGGLDDEIDSLSIKKISELPNIYFPVSVVSKNLNSCVNDQTYINGLIRNDQSLPLNGIRMIIWRLNSPEGNVVFAPAYLLKTTLLPGEVSEFYSLLFPYSTCLSSTDPPAEDVENYFIAGQGVIKP